MKAVLVIFSLHFMQFNTANTQCPEGQYQRNGSCSPCRNECLQCANYDKCTACPPGFYGAICEIYKFCEQDNCPDGYCWKKQFPCGKCAEGYYRDSDSCYLCRPNCLNCSNYNNCTDCRQEFCVDDHFHCSACVGPITKTTKTTTKLTKSTMDLTTKSTTKLTTNPTTKLTTKSTTKLTTNPTTKLTTKPTTDLTTNPTTKLTTKPTAITTGSLKPSPTTAEAATPTEVVDILWAITGTLVFILLLLVASVVFLIKRHKQRRILQPLDINTNSHYESIVSNNVGTSQYQTLEGSNTYDDVL